MMRWNSTKTYTEEDILRMQQEAVTRVHEFQSRAKALPFYDVPESAITPYQEPSYEAPSIIEEPSAPEDMTSQDEEPSEPSGFDVPYTPETPIASPSPTSNSTVHPNSPSEQFHPMNGPVNYNTPMNPTINQTPPPPQDPISGILSKLNLDSETLLILGLMFLLYNEKADNVLLIALAYLLL